MNERLLLAVLILLLCLGPAASFGQGTSESLPLRLRIVDEKGEPVAGARSRLATPERTGHWTMCGRMSRRRLSAPERPLPRGWSG
ncbi:MAG TPA: hypothetical protein VJ885_12165 [Thermoanaerobaculia bacterium]|nr:hypothetical protein [Thermoanaerobaculia bacterium]